MAIGVAVASFHRADWRRTAPVWALAVAVIVIGVIQLVPLSASVWRGLPGREVAAAITDAAGFPALPRPLSLDPEATVEALLATLPAFALALLVSVIDPQGRARLLDAVVAFAIVDVLLGAIQIATRNYYLYDFRNFGLAAGFFNNRNHNADLLVIAALFALLRLARLGMAETGKRVIGMVLVVLLAAAVVTTRSRSGLFFVAITAIVAPAIGMRAGHGRRTLTLSIAAVLAIAAAMIAFSPVVQAVLARYAATPDDGRFLFWRNTIYAIRLYWPAGSGLGTFVPVYGSLEPLSDLSTTYANNAHNDYLELLLETGLAGVIAVLLYPLALAVALRRAGIGRERTVALLGIAVLLLHSIVDYPMRVPALMAVFGLLNGLLLAEPLAKTDAPYRSRPRPVPQ